MSSCGTVAGYGTHRRRGEVPCQACRDACAMYEKQRRRRQGIDPRRSPVCGTYAGFTAHNKQRQPPCQACKNAHNEYQRRWRAKMRLRRRRGSIPHVITDYVETYGPMEMRELVLLIQLRHDIAESSIRRAANRMMSNGRLTRGVDIVTETDRPATLNGCATPPATVYTVQPEAGWVA